MSKAPASSGERCLELIKNPRDRLSVQRPGSKAVAAEIADLIRTRTAQGERAVLGLATGSTPTAVYDELIRLHQEEGLSFKNVVTFNLDEYYPMKPDELQSYVRFMREHLFDHIDIPRGNWHVPDGTLPREKVCEYCAATSGRSRRPAGSTSRSSASAGRVTSASTSPARRATAARA